MKNAAPALLLLISVSLYSCEPNALFIHPQPADAKSINLFPKQLQGTYASTNNNSTIIISDSFITRQWSLYKIDDSTTVVYQFYDTANVEKVSIESNSPSHPDIVFMINGLSMLKESNGEYFLNRIYGDSTWEVKKISLLKNELTIAGISIEDAAKLIEFTPSNISLFYLSVTPIEFKKFNEEVGFSEKEKFTISDPGCFPSIDYLLASNNL